MRPQDRTGKTLGSGTYAIVKEAVHIKTGKYYACKVINKKLMEGREYMVSATPPEGVSSANAYPHRDDTMPAPHGIFPCKSRI